MKKLICMLGHNARLMKTNECLTEDFENKNRAIRIFKCKYCGKDIFTVTRYKKIHFANSKGKIK